MKPALTVIIFSLLLICLKTNIFAQDATSSGVAIPTTIEENVTDDGYIICSGSAGYVLCNKEYDQSIYGVVSLHPSVSLGVTAVDNEKYIISKGNALVHVSTKNGTVKEGDLITTSTDPGVGMKAAKNGYVLGTALESLEQGEANIYVSINIHPSASFAESRSNLTELLKMGTSSFLLTPISAFRYLLAAIVVVISFVMGFVYSGRLAKTGVEAVARNPLAQKKIEFTVLLHILITIVIFLMGIGIAYLILVL